MRAMKRQIARHMMELAGIEKINKKQFNAKKEAPAHFDGRLRPDDGRKTSYFALHWRAYLDPGSEERAALHKKLAREFVQARRREPEKRMLQPWPMAPKLARAMGAGRAKR